MKYLFNFSIHPLDKLLNIFIGFSLCFFWCTANNLVLDYLYPDRNIGGQLFTPPAIYSAFIACLVAPVWEELLYRYGPLTIARKFNKEYVLPVLVMSSCLFGWAHGDCQEGVMIQGVMGFVFGCVYIKNGFSLASSIFLHFLWNLYCTIAPYIW